MKILTRLTILSLVTTIVFSCARSYPFVKRSEGFPPPDSVFARYAVLDFDYSGYNMNKKTADRAADQLSNELYSTLAFPVAERSIVKAAEKKYKSTKKSQITQGEIANIARETDSDFLVLGTLRLLGNIEDVLEDRDKQIELDIRFIDGHTGELVCIIQEKHYGDTSLEAMIHNSVLRSVNQLKLGLN